MTQCTSGLGLPLCPQEIGLPVLDELLDGVAIGQVLREDPARQFRQFIVPGEAESDELRERELADSWLQVGRQHLAESQHHLQADDPILDRDREVPGIEEEEQDAEGEQQPDRRVGREPPYQPVGRPSQVDDEDEERDPVIPEDVAGVVLVVLR